MVASVGLQYLPVAPFQSYQQKSAVCSSVVLLERVEAHNQRALKDALAEICRFYLLSIHLTFTITFAHLLGLASLPQCAARNMWSIFGLRARAVNLNSFVYMGIFNRY
jgi:hypothetical protein